MSFDDDEVKDDREFKSEDSSDDEMLDPMDDGINDFRFEEEEEDDPDNRYT